MSSIQQYMQSINPLQSFKSRILFGRPSRGGSSIAKNHPRFTSTRFFKNKVPLAHRAAHLLLVFLLLLTSLLKLNGLGGRAAGVWIETSSATICLSESHRKHKLVPEVFTILELVKYCRFALCIQI